MGQLAGDQNCGFSDPTLVSQLLSFGSIKPLFLFPKSLEIFQDVFLEVKF